MCCNIDFFIAHEAAVHVAKLRVELSQSKSEQQQYLKNVELARVLDKRAAKKREKGEEFELKQAPKKRALEGDGTEPRKKQKGTIDSVLKSIF